MGNVLLEERPAQMAEMADLGVLPTDRRIVEANRTDAAIILVWDDGRESTFHGVWLRDNCPCSSCRHPAAMERTFKFIDHAWPQAVTGVVISAAGDLVVTFGTGHDTHVSSFSAAWLRQHDYGAAARSERRPQRRLWQGSDLDQVPVVDFHDFVRSREGFRTWLEALPTWGLVLLRNAPAEPGRLLEIARKVGPVRPSNFGDSYDVISMPNPNASAYTSMALEPHTDLANWRSPPDYQLLFCIANDAEGGESILVDGYRVAEDLRWEEPFAFSVLCSQPITFRFHDESCDIQASAPSISINSSGEVVELRFNNWLRATLDLPEDKVPVVYQALHSLWRRLRDPRYRLKLKLEPGDMLAFDNHRVLHGRESFDPNSGHRHLQGCYITHDDVMSQLRLLARQDRQ